MPFFVEVVDTHELLAQQFGLSYKQLAELIYPTTSKSYKTLLIPKKNGGVRLINSPKIKLLTVQRKLCEILSAKYEPKDAVHGFVPERSILTNAENHVGKKFVFNIDLKDFFGSIHFGRVRNLLMAEPFAYSKTEAIILAQIACHLGKLPQGGATSPLISNMICWKLDAQLQTLAHKSNCTYSRYADDITFSFSCSERKLPRSIVSFDGDGLEVVGQTLFSIIEENGFSINTEKVRLQGRERRQEVTGITVNEFPNLKRKFIRQTSSMLYAWKKFGAINAEHEYLNKYRLKSIPLWQKESVEKSNGEFFKSVLIGRINYIQMIRGRHDSIYRKLAYRLTELLGKPNEDFKRSPEELATFILQNDIDQCQGTAFLLESVGLVTNQHVVPNISAEFQEVVYFHRFFETNNRTAEFKYSCSKRDIAIFSIENGEFADITALKVGDDSKLERGSKVIVIGFPGYAPTVSEPFVCSGLIVSKRSYFDLPVWVVDVPINHGCSGGPVLNEKFEVIGIATFGAEKNDGQSYFNGFIPISILIDYLSKKQSDLPNEEY